MGGKIIFKAAASFIENEVEANVEIGDFYGTVYSGGQGGAIMVSPDYPDVIELMFEGPVLFRGNKAHVRGSYVLLDSRRRNTLDRGLCKA